MGLCAPYTHFTSTYITELLGSIPEPVRIQGIGGALAIILEELYAHGVVVNSPLKLLLVSWAGHIEKVYPYV